ncbi:NADP-dependent aldehyde dehydrogenase [Silvibacterium bohemicum]|uniref:NADP-dependent aldehyde dehydrogenase n=1 Tax=Silvibacterium bohemicum TaxID=1577686 RepID=A0A841K107_9BACT|nr:aldehyde dehydrogenase (NADP(+)) [Silvibacterium bohemicum]MBB6143924.1 NADP-dependent aldehyde dehydrogenase [Silvibacterium bohemicum]
MFTGLSLLGNKYGSASGAEFYGINPATGEKLEARFVSAGPEDVDRAALLAEEAFPSYRKLSGKERAHFLRTIADNIQAIADAVIERANLETALPVARLQGELARTVNQLRLFADVAEEGSWTGPRIDTALPDRKPLPRPDIRSMLLPIGPVAVFGVSNFPLAFSVAGGDTASALAAGNTVVVKAHPAHPGTSELVGNAVRDSVKACGLHPGVFSLLFDSGIHVGQRLVQHPLIKAVGFTGSLAAGKALMQLCANRPEPIPCFTEMSSSNPVFILPGALQQYEKVAAELTASYTLGAGQFCTKPGLVLLPKSENADKLSEQLRKRAAELPEFSMLTPGIAAHYRSGLEHRAATAGVRVGFESANASAGSKTTAALLETEAADLLSNPALTEEIFGPTTLLVTCKEEKQMLEAARALQGHLTATLLGTEEDLAAHQELIAILERKVGRVIFNGYPTGVEVCHAMVHGGPFPATSDSRVTSVGSMAIFRFARPVCYQNLPQSALPTELKNENPLGVLRMVNGEMTRETIPS